MRWVLPEATGIGAAPQRRAKAALPWMRSALVAAVMRSLAAVDAEAWPAQQGRRGRSHQGGQVAIGGADLVVEDADALGQGSQGESGCVGGLGQSGPVGLQCAEGAQQCCARHALEGLAELLGGGDDERVGLVHRLGSLLHADRAPR